MRTPAFLLACAIAAALVPTAARAQHDHAGHAAGEQTAPATAAGQRWATDAPLRREMAGIREAVDALSHYERGHMGAEQAAQIAGEIESHVRTIIAECKLPPDADAALHTIIVPLMRNATALRTHPDDLATIPPMRQALGDYARRFDDPAFAATAEPEEAPAH